jgi:hypothetical protein
VPARQVAEGVEQAIHRWDPINLGHAVGQRGCIQHFGFPPGWRVATGEDHPIFHCDWVSVNEFQNMSDMTITSDDPFWILVRKRDA